MNNKRIELIYKAELILCDSNGSKLMQFHDDILDIINRIPLNSFSQYTFYKLLIKGITCYSCEIKS